MATQIALCLAHNPPLEVFRDSRVDLDAPQMLWTHPAHTYCPSCVVLIDDGRVVRVWGKDAVWEVASAPQGRRAAAPANDVLWAMHSGRYLRRVLDWMVDNYPLPTQTVPAQTASADNLVFRAYNGHGRYVREYEHFADLGEWLDEDEQSQRFALKMVGGKPTEVAFSSDYALFVQEFERPWSQFRARHGWVETDRRLYARVHALLAGYGVDVGQEHQDDPLMGVLTQIRDLLKKVLE